MVWRVIVKIAYTEMYVDFDGVQSAGDFATTVLTRAISDEGKPVSVRMELLRGGDDG